MKDAEKNASRPQNVPHDVAPKEWTNPFEAVHRATVEAKRKKWLPTALGRVFSQTLRPTTTVKADVSSLSSRLLIKCLHQMTHKGVCR